MWTFYKFLLLCPCSYLSGNTVEGICLACSEEGSEFCYACANQRLLFSLWKITTVVPMLIFKGRCYWRNMFYGSFTSSAANFSDGIASERWGTEYDLYGVTDYVMMIVHLSMWIFNERKIAVKPNYASKGVIMVLCNGHWVVLLVNSHVHLIK